MRVLRREWDASAATVAAVTFWIAVGLSSRPLEPSLGAVLAAISLGGMLGSAAFVSGRWVSDRLSKDEYGELIRAIDPQELHLQRPYQVVTYAGLMTVCLGVFVAMTLGEFSRSIAVFLYGLLLGLASYSVLGTISLVGITRRHQVRAALLRAAMEQETRERRAVKRNGCQLDNDSEPTPT